MMEQCGPRSIQLLGLLILAFGCAHVVGEICSSNVCEYYFTVTSQLTMMYGAHHLTYARNNSFFYKDNGVEFQVPDADAPSILALDGFERIAKVVNGQLPGPTIEVYEGAEIVIHVTNMLENDGLAIHGHGLWQLGSPWMDGVPMITQCAILPHETFTYRFFAEPAGTHWWHSHHGLQRPDGVFGALIIHEKNPASLHSKMCDVDNFVLSLNDWYHDDNTEVLYKRVGPGFYPHGAMNPPTNWTYSVDGKLVGEVPFIAALINGRARFMMRNGKMSETPLTEYNVQPGKRYCFRVIGAMMEKGFELSVDQHDLVVIASDGWEHDPVTVSSLVVHPGETWDFMIIANQPVDNYWIRARTMAANVTQEGLAILRYAGATPKVDPTSHPRPCTAQKVCETLNCPFPAFPLSYNKTCIYVDALRNYNKTEVTPNYPAPQFEEHFLNFVFEPLGVNRRRFVSAQAPLLTQFDVSNITQCNNTDCDYNACNCTHILTIPFNQTVQMVYTNIGPHAAGMHPVHLHGHSFYVVKIGMPSYDPVTGRVTNNITDDIECVPGTECAVAHWKKGKEPKLNLDHPPRKDTVIVPPGGYAVVRIITNNPGYWFMHCHMPHHLFWGMAMVLDAAPEYQPDYPPPPGFPTCGNFDYDNSYLHKMRKQFNKLSSPRL